MYGSVEQAFVGRDEPKNGCEGGYCASWVHNISTTVMTNIVVDKSADNAEPPFRFVK